MNITRISNTTFGEWSAEKGGKLTPQKFIRTYGAISEQDKIECDRLIDFLDTHSSEHSIECKDSMYGSSFNAISKGRVPKFFNEVWVDNRGGPLNMLRRLEQKLALEYKRVGVARENK